MKAIISDIHGNIEALNAVLEDIKKNEVSEVYCLGDVVGYGPSSRECLKKVIDFKKCIKGNHEAALLDESDANDFNPHARMALDWTRDQINSQEVPEEERRFLWNWIGSLEEAGLEDDFQMFHGSPRDPVREYVLPGHVRDEQRMSHIFSLIERKLCFIGHSHVPGIYTEDLNFYPSEDVKEGFAPYSGKTLVNVGSVGQPRDGDPRACYATWDKEIIRFHRVEYDFKKTMDKILGIEGLPKLLAFRLRDGR